ncbi:aminoacetone oxidase family FAD-binding enzyme [Pandoraea terrae]|uniref:Aminoacetone oxidase family FAD-binding enzyme n=2 Tax=Pandoraea terrae TaxID=1537710 RepID=A0A5E4S041_9BURK|nr:aminoacetone oxidase family FAD-binding enzyme [Pandoraea terrae]
MLAEAGFSVDVFDAMPSVGRKFLMAGKGGMNLTHSEPRAPFVSRYGARAGVIGHWLDDFGPDALRAWVHSLGIETFVGSSGRVFPRDMKAAPLLRAWLARLRANGVRLHVRHRWLGWQASDAPGPACLRFAAPAGEHRVSADAVVLALGGGSWPRLGSDAAWVPWLAARGVGITPLQSSNCGFETDWSAHFRARFPGEPVKAVAMALPDDNGSIEFRQGEFVVSEAGIEGSLVYALSARIRERINAAGEATILLDLLPGWTPERVTTVLMHPRGARSLSSHLQSRLGITGVKAGLLRECLPKAYFTDLAQLAHSLKALPLRLLRPRPMAETISTAGGVTIESLDEGLMVTNLPGVFCAGEMLDWEAPTGGYLLTACFASGRAAARGVAAHLARG